MYFSFIPIGRSEARRLGYTRYYTGKPCKRGHAVLRYVSSGKCWECHKSDMRKYESTEQGILNKRARRLRWHHANHKQSLAISREWKKDNRGRYLENIYARAKRLKQATPVWYDELDELIFSELKEKIAWLDDYYKTQHEIDHIYPLRGKTVCGLHCKENWQILTKSDNRSKFNKMPDWSY